MKTFFQHILCLFGSHDWSEWYEVVKPIHERPIGVCEGLSFNNESEQTAIVNLGTTKTYCFYSGNLEKGDFVSLSDDGKTVVKAKINSNGFEISHCKLCGALMGRTKVLSNEA